MYTKFENTGSNRSWEICDGNFHWRERKINKKRDWKAICGCFFFCYTIQLNSIKLCTKFQNHKSSSCWEIGEKEKWTNKGTEMLYVAVFCYKIQLITIKFCTEFQNPKSSHCWEIFDRKNIHMYYIRVTEVKNEKMKKEGKWGWASKFSFTQYTLPNWKCTQNLKTLAPIGAEKSVTEISIGEKENSYRKMNILRISPYKCINKNMTLL